MVLMMRCKLLTAFDAFRKSLGGADEQVKQRRLYPSFANKIDLPGALPKQCYVTTNPYLVPGMCHSHQTVRMFNNENYTHISRERPCRSGDSLPLEHRSHGCSLNWPFGRHKNKRNDLRLPARMVPSSIC